MMKQIVLTLLSIYALAGSSQAQGKFFTKTGKISFFSSTALENIEATNKSAVCLLDSRTGNLQFAVQLKGFEFKKALMQEHFNSDYIESDQYPKSEFKGQLTNNSNVNYNSDGNYAVTVQGKLTIHGATKDVEAKGIVSIKDGKPGLSSSFSILIADYNIKVPKMYQDNISNSIKLTVSAPLEPLK